jgi:hypothetical protein
MSIRRALSVVAGLAVLTGGLSACNDDGPAALDIAAIKVPPEKIASVTFTAAGKSATFSGKDGIFLPGPGATPESATLLNAANDSFPVLAYRIIDDADVATPAFGLVAAKGAAGPPAQCGGGCSMAVTSVDGTTHKLTVGAQTFNYAGYYGTVEGDPRVFLLISATVAQIISMATGKPFSFPKTQQELQLEQKTDQIAKDASGGGSAEANYDPYLRQVLAAEQDRKAAKEGKPGGALLRAATSTQDQPGGSQSTASPEPEGTNG